MKPEVWTWLRWVIVFGVCALVVVVGVPMAIDAVTGSIVVGGNADDGDDAGEVTVENGSAPSGEEEPGEGEAGEEESSGDVPTGPVADGEAGPDADFVVRDGTVRQASTGVLSLSGDDDAAVLLFPLIEGDPDCVATAELGLSLQEAEQTEVAVYAGDVQDVPEDGDEVGNPRQGDVVYALAFTDGSPGRLRWDLTDLYRSWASGDLASPGAPFAVVVAVPDGSADVLFAASESDDAEAPALVWEGQSGCGGSA